MRFKWDGFNAMGKTIDGEMDAASMEDAAGRLREQKIFVSHLNPMAEIPKAVAPAAAPVEESPVPEAPVAPTCHSGGPPGYPGLVGQGLPLGWSSASGYSGGPGVAWHSGYSGGSGYNPEPSGFHFCECAAPGHSAGYGGKPECIYCHHLIKPDWKSNLSDQLKTISEICDTATEAGIPADIVGPIAKEMIRQLLMTTWNAFFNGHLTR